MSKPKICLYFHVHQPSRLKRYSVLDKTNMGRSPLDAYFDSALDCKYFQKIANQCYRPANKIIEELLSETDGAFKLSFSISGAWIEQCKQYAPDVLESFKRMANTGSVEFVDETNYHSLSSLWWDSREFKDQVSMHSNTIAAEFGQQPVSFRNTELLYSNQIAHLVDSMGYSCILAEGVERVLGHRSPNYVYQAQGTSGLKLLLRNYRLSDDIGFRFSDRNWSQWPLTADKYVGWLGASGGQVVNLFMDYETFGEHHWPGSGIMDFLYWMPKTALREDMEFCTTGQAAKSMSATEPISVNGVISWADMERDASAWLGNKIQDYAFEKYWSLESQVKQAGGQLLEAWRSLGISDHYMYLCLKSWSDGDVHKHFSPYKDWTPYDNFINYMNILTDLKRRLEQESLTKHPEEQELGQNESEQTVRQLA